MKKNLLSEKVPQKKVFINGIPKSGINLLQKLLYELKVPYSGDSLSSGSLFGKFSVLKSFFRHSNFSYYDIGLDLPCNVSKKWVSKILSNANGYVSGHVRYSEPLFDLLKEENYKIISIVRHPYAILNSSVNFFGGSNYHIKEYKKLFIKKSYKEKIRILFDGITFGNQLEIYPFSEVLDNFNSWLVNNRSLVIKYEDLVGYQGGGSNSIQIASIKKIINFLNLNEDDFNLYEISEKLYGDTPTFSSGKIASWKKYFSRYNITPPKKFSSNNFYERTYNLSSENYSGANFFPKILIASEGYGDSKFGVANVVASSANFLNKRNLNIRVISMEDSKPQNPFYFFSIASTRFFLRLHWRQFSDIRWNIEIFSPDIIHLHGILRPFNLYILYIAFVNRIKVVVSFHGMLLPNHIASESFFSGVIKYLYRILLVYPLLRRASFFHAITKIEKKSLSKLGFKKPIYIIPNYIDPNLLISDFNSPPKKSYFLFVGRICQIKGVELIIKAMILLRNKNIRLIIAGPIEDDSYYKNLINLINKNKLSNNIKFIGHVGKNKRNKLYRGAWITLVPSRSEAMALVNLESSFSFTPTITTYNTGLNEWSESGGILCKDNPKALSAAIAKSLSWSLSDRKKFGQKAHDYVKNKYLIDIVMEDWLKFYMAIFRD